LIAWWWQKLVKKRKTRAAFILIGLLLLGSIASQSKDETWREIQDRGVLRVGVDPTYPPFAQTDGVSLTGIDIELAQALTEGMGVEVAFSLFGYDGLYDALGTAQVDILISAMVIAPERGRDFAYSEPYFNAGEVLLVPLNSTNITGMADLDGRSLAVELGALGHVEAISWAKRLAGLTILTYPTAVTALTAVGTGEADVALVDGISGRLFMRETQGLQLVKPAVTVEPYAVVVRIGDERLLQEVNNILSALQESGQLDTIIEKWMGP
jgi:polar amino acid transport system substrate-binding protein